MTSDASTIIGRADEVRAVRTFIDSIDDGPTALVLTGEPGIGKSTLWREGVRLAREQDFEVLECRPVESEAQLAFTSLSDLLVDISHADLDILPAPQHRALEVALLRAEPDGDELPPARRCARIARPAAATGASAYGRRGDRRPSLDGPFLATCLRLDSRAASAMHRSDS